MKLVFNKPLSKLSLKNKKFILKVLSTKNWTEKFTISTADKKRFKIWKVK